MRYFSRPTILSFIISIVTLSYAFAPSVALAERKMDDTGTRHIVSLRQGDVEKEMHMTGGSESGSMGQHHGSDSARMKKTNACQAREKSITTRSTHLNARVLQMEKTFDSIAQGVEKRYTTVLVPAGKTVAGYDTLVSSISSQQAALLPLLATVDTDVSSFTCTGDNPGAQVTKYRTDMQAVIKGLQAYRKSVRNLIVAVAKAEGTAASGKTGTATGSAEPTAVVTP